MFNLFKKNQKQAFETKIKPRTILCIPGDWNNRTEVITAIAENNMNDLFSLE